ncbi:MAG: AsmA-like C-terminal domain-containing protein [Sulfurimonas sp.]|nr:AsmA-like C-terminal domain-containing protein [Sulfurimonas sp.]
MKTLSLASNWFESIVIEKIRINDISASFKYKDGKRGFIVASSPNFYLNSSIYYESNFLNMKISEFKDFKRKINLDGSLFFNPKDIELSTVFNININDDLDAKILIHTDKQRLDYKLISNKKIKDITHLIDLANLPKEVRYWALDAIDMSYATIDSANGFIEFDKLNKAYKNIHIKATTNKMNYTYDKKLDSIHTKKTLLEFKDGVLFIYPKEAYSYGMFLDKSWLKVDFNKKEELLTLHLLFDGMTNKDMLKILSNYKIDLPFLQRKGKVTTNLTITVNLITIDIDAKGDFFTKEANFDYLGLNIDIFDAYIKLNNYDVEINNMKAKYKDIATANVDVLFNAKAVKGTISFQAEYIGLNNVSLLLDKRPIKIVYNISPNNDTIDIEKSKWKYDDFILNMDKVSIPFDIEKLLVKLPATYFEIDGVASGFVAGNIPIDTMKLDLRTDILKLNYKGIELSQSDIPLNIRYDDGLTVSSASNILFNIDGFEFDLNNAVLDIGAYSLSLKHANLLSIDGLLSSKINAFYNFKNGTGIIGLKDLNIQDKESLFYSKDKLIFSLKSLKGNTTIRSEELDSKIIIKDAGWDIKLNSLAKIANDSQFLKKFRLTQGKVALHKKSHEKFIKLNADIKYPYKLLVENNTPTQNYKIRVKISPKKAFVNINENINVEVDDNIALNIKNCGINIPEVLNLLRDINTSSNKEDNKRVLLDASNSYLYVGHDRKIISDRMSLQYQHGITTAQLEHKDGHAGFKLENKDIHLYGENFNDEFMENLFSLAKFKDGKLNFSMNGTIENYDGLFYITDTTIVDYKMLNNILAFINTVPALTTFSLPGYNKTGLKVKSAYMNFNAKNSVFTVSDFFLDSKEIDILGGGVADLNKDKIDVTLNLKTDLGSSVSKIPLVGYILLGDDNTISTTMKITGKLTDPDVKSLIAKDIVVAPINIITRALLLPYDLIKAIKNTNESK